MGLRPGRCSRNIERSFTRVAPKVQRKNYLGGVPGVRTRSFAMGNQTKDFDTVLDIVAKKDIQVRDNALEAMRQKLIKRLTESVGKEDYFVKIRLYPHHILREHKAASGAGADRVSSGMKLAYGKKAGRAAQVRKGQTLVSVVIDSAKIDVVRKLLQNIKYKVNLPFTIVQSKHENMRLSGRKKWTREAKIAKAKGQSKEEETPVADSKNIKKEEDKAKAPEKKESNKKNTGNKKNKR